MIGNDARLDRPARSIIRYGAVRQEEFRKAPPRIEAGA
jgi:hypothetical protein